MTLPVNAPVRYEQFLMLQSLFNVLKVPKTNDIMVKKLREEAFIRLGIEGSDPADKGDMALAFFRRMAYTYKEKFGVRFRDAMIVILALSAKKSISKYVGFPTFLP